MRIGFHFPSPDPPGADGVGRGSGQSSLQDTADHQLTKGQIWHNSDAGKSYAYWSSQSVWVSM